MVATLHLPLHLRLPVEVSVPSRGFDGCNDSTGWEWTVLQFAEFQSPRGESMVATWDNDRQLSIRLGQFQSPRGDSMVATAAILRIYDSKVERFQSPRGDSMVATSSARCSATGPRRCFSPLAGIRWLQHGRTRGGHLRRRRGVSVPSRGFDGCKRVTLWHRACGGRTAVSVPSRGFDGCNSGMASASARTSPCSFSPLAGIRWLQHQGLHPGGCQRLAVSVPSRGFDGCNTTVTTYPELDRALERFQSPRGDSMVATRR